MTTRAKYKVEDYLDQRFGSWTVLGFSHVSDNGDIFWNCKCDCGIKKSVLRQGIMSGRSKQCRSCGYKNRAKCNLIPLDKYLGTKINSWTVLGFSHHSETNGQFWYVKCDCGTQSKVSAIAVVNGHSKRCIECRRDDKCDHNRKLSFPAHLYQRAKKGAEKRHFEWTITHEETSTIWDQHQFKCSLSGVPIICGRTAKHESTASMDRIDSDFIGTVPGNIQFVHKTVNRLKSNFSETEFVQWCRLIAEHTSTI